MIDRIEHAPCGILVLNGEGFILEANQTMLNLIGYSLNDIKNKHFEALLSPISKMVYHSFFYPTLHLNGSVKELIVKCLHTNGSELSFMVSGSLTANEEGVFIDCVLLEMTKRIQYEEQLKEAQRQAKEAYLNIERLMEEIESKQIQLLKMNEDLTCLSNTDKLTGLKNRRFFQERFDQLYNQFLAVNVPLYLLVIDIDYFKKVNDTFGHHAGDVVLTQLAEVIQSTTSDQLEAFRYGGEEFVLLVTAADEDYIQATAERLRKVVEDVLFTTGHITISIGGANMREGLTQENLFELADKALYASKQNGRNRVTFLT